MAGAAPEPAVAGADLRVHLAKLQLRQGADVHKEAVAGMGWARLPFASWAVRVRTADPCVVSAGVSSSVRDGPTQENIL